MKRKLCFVEEKTKKTSEYSLVLEIGGDNIYLIGGSPVEKGKQ